MEQSDIYIIYIFLPATMLYDYHTGGSGAYTQNTTGIQLKSSKTHFSSESIAASRNNSVYSPLKSVV